LPQIEWIAEDAAGLENPKLFSTDPVEAWQRLRGLEQLQPEERAVAKALAAWREQRAIQKDLPRSWVLSDDVLRSIAERLPTTPESLQSIQGLAPGLASKRGSELLELIATARTHAASEPEAKIAFKPTRAQMKKVARLMDAVRGMGTELQISPELLATRREVERLVYTGQSGSFMQGWRADVVGKRLMALVQEIREEE
jgi:ribonuclease D